MKKILFSSILLISIFASLSFSAEMQFPEHKGYVNDYAGVLSDEYAKKIAFVASKLEENTGAQLAVLTIKSARPLDTKSYAVQVFQKWGIGQKNKDNGLLILFSKRDRRMEIEVGYGLEGTLPDGLVGAVMDKYALPQFKKDDYARGIYLTVLALSDRVMKEYGSTPKTRIEQINLNLYSVALAFSVIILVFAAGLLGRTWYGAMFSGTLGAAIGFFVAGIAGIFFGFLIGIIISTGGYYGGYRGGGFGGGFGTGSGGGFGGFGGGRSGGGGAGRSF